MNSTALTEFLPFPRLPTELQSAIIERAFPKPAIVDFSAYIFANRNTAAKAISISVPCYPELLPFLMACKESNSEVFRRYQKIEMVIPSAIEKFYYDDQLKDAYVRTKVDTLLLQTNTLTAIYRSGGHMNLESITSLALDNAFIKEMYTSNVSDDLMMGKQVGVYTLLSIHCPALKKLSILIEKRWGEIAGFKEYPEKSNLRIMGISGGLMDLDFHLAYHGVGPSHWNSDSSLCNRLKVTHNDALKVMGDFDRFLNHKEDDSWTAPGEATLKYWKSIRPMPGILCVFDDSPTGRYNVSQENTPPRLFVLDFAADISCHLYGTPLHVYKGLAQIFDGAPW
ncbi:hypothetical protein EYC80_010327 [Monilinia laxa]|uniref:2EXR domain-containing protein n=1 Tax=Monilinia laxa TaxID=61186 RepID=A0A5N6JPW6_MONLA|nr:hypothetical protein EYC80_010327 [Monilinia laxa]